MRKEILVIPDVHGRVFWKEAVSTKGYAKIIFLGDYIDPYKKEGITSESAMENFMSIIDFKKRNPDKVVLLLGNHDLHYYSDYYCALAQSVRYNPIAANTLHCLFEDHRQLFELAWETDCAGKRYLFSHAGVTQTWLKRNIELITEPDANHLNRLLLSNAGLAALAQVGEIRCGFHPSGSMVWADVEEMLMSDPLPDTYQIVGHSMQLDGPVIAEHFACLDCRAAFSLDSKGTIKPVTKIPGYEGYL